MKSDLMLPYHTAILHTYKGAMGSTPYRPMNKGTDKQHGLRVTVIPGQRKTSQACQAGGKSAA
jgi:hypothetical protein